MKQVSLVQLALRMLVLIGIAANGIAAEITVAPGSGTLAAALSSAANGDVLVLQDGSYSGALTINKSITIRAASRSVASVLPDPVTVNAADINVTIQGLQFSNTLTLMNARSIKVLENRWTNGGIDTSNFTNSSGLGSLVIIGNSIENGSIGHIRSDGAYVAGNYIRWGVSADSETSTWIVGNTIAGQSNFSGTMTRVIGNRFVHLGGLLTIHVNGATTNAYAYFANNLISTGNIPSIGAVIDVYHGTAEFVNNVVTCQSDGTTTLPVIRANEGYNGIVRATANVFFPENASNDRCGGIVGNVVAFADNFCQMGVCPNFSGNYVNPNTDPGFVDLVDFKLLSGSPLIDAGPQQFDVADLNRTRNDIGIYGGPWSIEQFDHQRDPQNLSPFVYPVFSGGSHIGGGQLQLQAIGVSRLR